MRSKHAFTCGHQCSFVFVGGYFQVIDEFQHPLILIHRMCRGAENAIRCIRLNLCNRVVVKLMPGQKLGSNHRVWQHIPVILFKRVNVKFGQMLDRAFTILGPSMVDDAFPHERSNANIAIGSTSDRMFHHRIDADKCSLGWDFDFPHDAARAAQDMGQFSLSPAGDCDLIHNSTRCTHDQIFGQLA